MRTAARPSTARWLLRLTLALVLVGLGLFGPSSVGAADSDPCIGKTPPPALQVSSAARSSVYRLYCAGFLRQPDTSGLDYWTSELLAHRVGVDTMAESFINSAEFAARYGDVDDREFLDLVYRNVLGRPSDEQGYQYWASVLAGRNFGREDLLIAFSESAEFIGSTNTAALVASGEGAFTGGLDARSAADRELALGTHDPDQCWADRFGGNVRWVRGAWDLTWCIRTDPNWQPWITDAVYVHEAFHVRVSLLYTHREHLTPTQRAEVERVVNDGTAGEGLADLWAMRLVPEYEGAPQYASYLFTNAIWEELFSQYPLGGPLPS